MTNDGLNRLLEERLIGCEDRHIEASKCAKCIYNLAKEGMAYCMFHDVE